MARHVPCAVRAHAAPLRRTRGADEHIFDPGYRRPAAPAEAGHGSGADGHQALARERADGADPALEGLAASCRAQIPAERRAISPNGKAEALYAAYQDRLRALNAADFGDLLLHTVRSAARPSRKCWRSITACSATSWWTSTRTPTWCSIYWLRLLAQGHQNICCVGDDDQTHLFLARRRDREHPAIRARFPRRQGHPAGGELPLHRANSGRGLAPHRP